MIRNKRSTIYHALSSKINSSSTLDIIGIDLDTYRNRIEIQMTSDMIWNNIEIDDLKPICMFDMSNNDELKEAFNWKNLQPLEKKLISKMG